MIAFENKATLLKTVESRNISEMKKYIRENTQEIMPQQKNKPLTLVCGVSFLFDV